MNWLNLCCVHSRTNKQKLSANGHFFQPSKTMAASAFVDRVNVEYERVHKAFEDNFWAVKMNLQGNSTEALTQSKLEMDNFLSNKDTLAECRVHLQQPDLSEQDRHVLLAIQRTLLCYITENPDAKALKEKITGLESNLERKRNTLELGYTVEEAGFVKASSVQLRNLMKTSPDEKVRKAAYEGELL